MRGPTDDQIFSTWRDQEAALLPVLHAFHDRDGFLSDEAIRGIGRALKIPLAELFGTVTFYHHFSRIPEGAQAPRVCTGPVCRLRGADALLDAMRKDGATPMACSGRCDEPIPVLRGHETWLGSLSTELIRRSSPLPAVNPAGVEECVFRHIREPGRATLTGYRKSHGYLALDQARALSPAALRERITESKLAGRGGAGFPTGLKWKAVAEAPAARKFVVCNADEGEPGCFKDRALMDHDPHALLEGMAIAGHATGAQLGIIYLRYEYPETLRTLQVAIDEALAAGLIGKAHGFEIIVRRGAGAYICG
ncbi:MAG: NAD(P)H-dependent oxidoreductase subunit E, partial [Planctomycetes bacterium]|nr:NAD(P)H-dependent oxidoreductase subunit E [Planctomycetota bacterium]